MSILALFVAEVFLIGLPTAEKQYDLNFSLKGIFNSYFWYFIWSLGMPEMLLDFVGPGIKLNPNLFRYWGNFFKVIFPAFFILSIFLSTSLFNLRKSKLLLFFVFWLFIGILPVVVLPFHKQYYYLSLVLPAFGAILGMVFVYLQDKNKYVAIIYLGLCLLINFVSVKLGDRTYWSINRAKIAKFLIESIKNKYPTLPSDSKVYFTNSSGGVYFNEDWGSSSKQTSIILSGSDAVQLIYNDRSILAYYEDLDATPSGKFVYPVEAVISNQKL